MLHIRANEHVLICNLLIKIKFFISNLVSDLWLWQGGHKLKTPAGYFKIAKVPPVDMSVAAQARPPT